MVGDGTCDRGREHDRLVGAEPVAGPQMPLLAAAQPRAWARATAIGMRLQRLSGLLLLIMSITLATFAQGLAAGFAALDCLLLGAALLLPAVFSGGLWLLQRRSSGALTTWFWADT